LVINAFASFVVIALPFTVARVTGAAKRNEELKTSEASARESFIRFLLENVKAIIVGNGFENANGRIKNDYLTILVY
jgi:hypothetical protein